MAVCQNLYNRFNYKCVVMTYLAVSSRQELLNNTIDQLFLQSVVFCLNVVFLVRDLTFETKTTHFNDVRLMPNEHTQNTLTHTTQTIESSNLYRQPKLNLTFKVLAFGCT